MLLTQPQLLPAGEGGGEGRDSGASPAWAPLGGSVLGLGPDLQRRSIPGMADGADAQAC